MFLGKKLNIFDTAGREEYICLTPNFYRAADSILFVFDPSVRSSLNLLEFWLNEAEDYKDRVGVKVFLG